MLSKNVIFVSATLVCATAGRAQITLNTVPTREIGQPQLLSNPFAIPNANPNLVEGRELYNPAGVALDTSVTPPRIYVADTNNNRILAWKDAVGFTNGAQADLVIGQRDFFSTGANGPGVSGGLSTGFTAPTGLAVDQGDLYVADSGNNRVLRFRKPFTTPPDQLTPDLCIGQPSFNANKPNYPLGQNTTPTEKGIALNTGSCFCWRDRVRYPAQPVVGGCRKQSRPALRGQRCREGWIRHHHQRHPGNRPARLHFPAAQPARHRRLQTLNQLATPAAIAFDTAGRLYIADSDGAVPDQPRAGLRASVHHRHVCHPGDGRSTAHRHRRSAADRSADLLDQDVQSHRDLLSAGHTGHGGGGFRILAHPDLRSVRSVAGRCHRGLALGKGSFRPHQRHRRHQQQRFQEPDCQ